MHPQGRAPAAEGQACRWGGVMQLLAPLCCQDPGQAAALTPAAGCVPRAPLMREQVPGCTRSTRSPPRFQAPGDTVGRTLLWRRGDWRAEGVQGTLMQVRLRPSPMSMSKFAGPPGHRPLHFLGASIPSAGCGLPWGPLHTGPFPGVTGPRCRQMTSLGVRHREPSAAPLSTSSAQPGPAFGGLLLSPHSPQTPTAWAILLQWPFAVLPRPQSSSSFPRSQCPCWGPVSQRTPLRRGVLPAGPAPHSLCPGGLCRTAAARLTRDLPRAPVV